MREGTWCPGAKKDCQPSNFGQGAGATSPTSPSGPGWGPWMGAGMDERPEPNVGQQ